jgi:phosphoglycolate phosphatase
MVDLDGTMVDTLGDFEMAVNAMLEELGSGPLERATIGPMVGKGSEHLVDLVLQRVGSTHEHADALRIYLRHYARVNGQYAEVFQGAQEGLQALRDRGLKLACLTNKPQAMARELLQAKGLLQYFSLVFGGDSFERKKPDPLPLVKTCEALGTYPAQTLMLGDSANDAQAARAAGCPVVLVTYGYNHGEPVREVDADGFFDSIGEIAAALPA